MKIQTLSIVAGSEACNARCPFCVSKMTPPLGVELKEPEVNWRNFEVACRLARRSHVTTAMFTGKGEPTLFPHQITRFLTAMRKHQFPLIELQTNGTKLVEENYLTHLRTWYDLGMTTIAISVVHYSPDKNRQIYLPYKDEYIDLPKLIANLHGIGFSIRLTCIGARGYIDGVTELRKLVSFASANKVEQLTFTPVNKPEKSLSKKAWEWTVQHYLTEEEIDKIREFLDFTGDHVLTLAHGAKVYDLQGQNICLNHCLTVQPDKEEMRNLIFFPDGHLRYYWQYPGAILL